MKERVGGEGRGGAGGGRKESSEADTHLADPVDVGGHPGEDRGLLESVAAQPGAEADDAPHLPGAVLRLAVQRASRVPLHQAGQVSGPRPPPEAGLGSRGGSGWPLSLGPLFWSQPSTARKAEKMWFGAAFASVGEVLGCQTSSSIAV